MDTLIAEIGRVRDRYAESLRGGGSTDIEPWLDPWQGPQRAALFRLLLSVLLDESRRRDLTLYQSKLSEQFSDYNSIIEDLFQSDVSFREGVFSGETRSYFVDTSITATKRIQPAPAGISTRLQPLWCDNGGRYRILDELARGGMGAVLRADDCELNRTVALKVILPEFRQNSGAVRRFHQEARITGQLQHPGIPPVHDVGLLGNECPFFAMKLIEGQSLSSLLRARTSPEDDLPRFIAIFENICQAVAYAHTRGVIHRDLKPANIMVGEFGEVQVMDWGLARWTRKSEQRAAETESAPLNADGLTQPGAAMGTPSYMPPEQACGLNDAIDERSDVFGLAGILCMILTGRPPYSGSTTAEVMEKCYRADLQDAHERLLTCGAPAELIRIARQGLSGEQSERPANAGLLARDVLQYRESAERELQANRIRQATEEARSVERRKRRLAWGMVTVATALIAGLVAFGSWNAYRETRQFEATADQKLNFTEQQLSSAELASFDPQQMKILLDSASVSMQELQTQLSETGRRMTLGGETRFESLKSELQQLQNDQAVLVAFRKSRKRATEVDAASGSYNDQQAFQELTTELRQFGIAPDVTTPERYAESLRMRHPEVARQLQAVLQFASVQTSDQELADWLLRTLTLLDTNGEQRVLLEILRKGDFADQAGVLDTISPESYSPELLFSVAQRMPNSPAQLRFLRRARFAWPNDFWLNHLLGNQCEASTYLRENRENAELVNSLHVEAISCLNAAAAIEPENTGNIVNLGIALQNWGDHQAALKMFTRAIELDPNYGAAHVMKGEILMQSGQFEEGVAEFETAIRVAPDFGPGYANLARWHGQNGRFDLAAEYLRKAVALKPAASYYLQLGRAYGALNDYDRAIPEWEKAVALDPDFFEANFILGLTSLNRKQAVRATTFLEQAHRIKPADLETLQYLGLAYRETQQDEKAIKTWQDALAIDPNHGPSHAELGKLLYLTGRNNEAIHHLVKMHELGLGTPGTRVHMAVELAALGRIEEAQNACREAIAANPEFSNAWFTLSELQAHTGELDDAIRSVQRAMEIDDPNKPSAEQFESRLVEYQRQLVLKNEQSALTMEAVESVESSRLNELAKISHEWMKHYHLAARLYQRRFSADVVQTYPIQPTERFYSACVAALAASEHHYDHRVAARDGERVECRQMALNWLTTELSDWQQLYPTLPAQSQASMKNGLDNWLKDDRLKTVRDPTHLEKLPPAERESWQSFWNEVRQWREQL